MDQIVFFVLSLIAVGSSLMVILSRNPIYSVLFTIVAFFAIGGHFLVLSAEFLFIVNVIVYAGAIMVLFLYAIMMLNMNRTSENSKPMLIKVIGAVSGGLLLVVLLGALRGVSTDAGHTALATTDIGTVKKLGVILFTKFLVPFELSSALFLSAMIGAVMIGKKNLKDH